MEFCLCDTGNKMYTAIIYQTMIKSNYKKASLMKILIKLHKWNYAVKKGDI